MPCWVAPVVAAELWGVSLSHVQCAIADGSLPSRREYGFVVVDVAPEGVHPQPHRSGPPPRTYVLVSEVTGEAAAEVPEVPELTAAAAQAPEPELLPEPFISEPIVPEAIVQEPAVEEPVSDELPPLDEEEDEKPISHWRQVRSSMGRMRKPPARTPPSPTAFAA